MIEFIYKGSKYTWEEWHISNKKFEESLELPEDYKVDFGLRHFLPVYDSGYAIASDKFFELYHLIASARNALINAHQKFFDSNIMSWEHSYLPQLWMRFQYLKNAIVWYDSCEDYILQIIWFGFEMYPIIIDGAESYKANLKKCNYSSVIKRLGEIADNNIEAKNLKDTMAKYHNDEEVKNLRNNLANVLKHHGNLQIGGLEDIRLGVIQKKDKNGDDIFNSKWIDPDIVDIDETIQLIKSVHEKFIIYGRYVMNSMNFNSVFELDESGNWLVNKIREKTDYKKIDFSNITKRTL